MDSKNVLMAVILSTVIIVGWQVLVVDPELKKTKTEVTKVEQTTSANNGKPSAPSINNKLPAPQKLISRTDAVSSEQRVRLENEKLTGSISLNGALIDDVVLKTYKETLDKNSKQVVILNPKKAQAQSASPGSSDDSDDSGNPPPPTGWGD